MDAGAFYVFHHAGDQHALAVADGVYFALLALHIAVDQDGLVGGHFGGGGEVADQLGGVLDDFHRPAAEDVAGADDSGVADGLRHLQRFADGGDGGAGGLRDAETGQKVIELVAVGGDVDGFGAGAQDGHSGLG